MLLNYRYHGYITMEKFIENETYEKNDVLRIYNILLYYAYSYFVFYDNILMDIVKYIPFFSITMLKVVA